MMVLAKIKKSLQNLINDTANPETPGQLNFENLGTVLYRIGLLQNLEFVSSVDKPNQSSLSLNQLKIKPERLAQEVFVKLFLIF